MKKLVMLGGLVATVCLLTTNACNGNDTSTNPPPGNIGVEPDEEPSAALTPRDSLLARYEELEALSAREYVECDGRWYVKPKQALADVCGLPDFLRQAAVLGTVTVRPVPERSPEDVFASLMESSIDRIGEFTVVTEPITGEYYAVRFPDDLDVMRVVAQLKATQLFAYVAPVVGLAYAAPKVVEPTARH